MSKTVDLKRLNKQFGLADQLRFKAGPGGLPLTEIDTAEATATISLYGGHLLAFQPRGHKPVIWTSQRSLSGTGQPIRGGIPVCWPWFATHPTDAAKPSHGFVRTMMWQVAGTRQTGDATELQLTLSGTEESRALWPHSFELGLTFSVGQRLHVELTARNTGPEAFSYTGALHSYFAVSDVRQIAISGLAGCDYLDKVDAFRQKRQQGDVTIAAETDRIYLNTVGECIIIDRGWERQIQVVKAGSRSTVVWNPWQARAKQIEDMSDEAYLEMVCVETANAAGDIVTVAPGETELLQAAISVR